MPDYGKIAYDAYCGCSHGKSLVSGETLPPWEELSREIRRAWEWAADAVLDAESEAN